MSPDVKLINKHMTNIRAAINGLTVEMREIQHDIPTQVKLMRTLFACTVLSFIEAIPGLSKEGVQECVQTGIQISRLEAEARSGLN